MAAVPAFDTLDDTLTVTSNAALVTSQPTASLVMGAKGVIINSVPPLATTTWEFGTVELNATGVHGFGIKNDGNANALMTLPLFNNTDTLFGISLLDGAGHPTPGGISSGPITLAASSVSSVGGTFKPVVASGNWTDHGTLTIVPDPGTSEVLCQALPAGWASPVVTLVGEADATPVISLGGTTSITFAPTLCDASAPAAQQIAITNSADSAINLDAWLERSVSGTSYYTLTSSTGSLSGTPVPAYGGTVTITVTPKWPLDAATFPATGTAPYNDNLHLVFANGTSNVLPITMTVTGTVLTLSYRGGDTYATANGGPDYRITNNGTTAATVTPTFITSAVPAQAADFSMTNTPVSVGSSAYVQGEIDYNFSPTSARCHIDAVVTFGVSASDHLCNVAPTANVTGHNRTSAGSYAPICGAGH
jgi:hypothetical protein